MNPITRSPFFGAIAAALGIGTQIQLPPHLPYVPYKANTGRRRTGQSRINRAAWKCNERKALSKETRGHLHDILLTVGTRATVQCRRCNKIETVDVHTKPYTQNKNVALTDPERIARAEMFKAA